MRLRKVLLLIFVSVYVVQLAQAGTEQDIIQGLQANTGGTFTLPAGFYEVHSQIKMPENTVLQGETDSSGQLLTKIVLASDLTLGEQIPVIEAHSGDKILYLDFDGNSQDRPTVPAAGHASNGEKQWGGGYDNFIGFTSSDGLEVAYCNFYNNLGDGVRAVNSKNINFHNNRASKGGHDVFYSIRSEGVWAHDNYIQPRVNAALRAMDCSGLLFSNNTIVYVREYDGVSYDAGPAIQIQNDNGQMSNVEVCYNTIYNSWGPGFWVVAKTHNGQQNANIHNNVMYDAGANHGIYWAAGMIISGYDDLNIHNNVFDSSYRGGIVYYAVNPGWATEAVSNLSANIFTDAKPGASDNNGGYGVLNQISAQIVQSSENCYYNNPAGNTEGCSVSSSDLFNNPRETSTPSGYSWDGTHWTCPGMPPESFNYVPGGVYDGLPGITPEEEAEFEFNDIFDILDAKFTDTGRTDQAAEDIYYSVQETEQGRISGGIKIIGFKDLINIDGVPYIPDNDSILVKYEAVKAPSFSWNNTGVSNIKKDVDIKNENGNITATLTVKMEWYKLSANSTGATKKKHKTSEAVFSDTVKAPHVLSRPSELKGILYEYPIHSLAYVPSGGLTKVKYEYDGKEVNHIYLLGEQHRNENGIIYTNFSKVNYWKGDLPHSGEFLFINGSFDPEKLTVTAYTPYESFQVTHFDYVKTDYLNKFYADWLFPSFGLFVILGLGAWYYIRKIIY